MELWSEWLLTQGVLRQGSAGLKWDGKAKE